MKIHRSDKAIAWLTLFSGLTISAVAIYYSVAGLTAIFAAAVIPIIVMGVALEISKLAATVWLKQNWHRAPNFIRGYLLAAIAILMLITSMGIFGFLSKAHSDQSLISGDVQSKIAVYDEKIKTAKDNIDANRRALKQLDDAVDQVMARSTSETGADKAVAIRRGQAKERSRLLSEIAAEQKTISQLSEERAPIAAEVRKVEAEVGPIKYIANFIYGDNPDANVLEKAVTWVIVIIVVVFDPLAVILLLASQYSFMWFRKEQEEADNDTDEFFEKAKNVARQLDQDAANDDVIPKKLSEDPSPPGWPFMVSTVPSSVTNPENFGLDKLQDTLPEAEERHSELVVEDDQEILDSAIETEKQAMQAWKHDNPSSSLKIQKRLFERGVISELPWASYIQPKVEYSEEQEAAIEAAKWAQEQLENKNEITWMENEDGQQVKKSTYQQNAEQSERTIWQRIQDAKK